MSPIVHGTGNKTTYKFTVGNLNDETITNVVLTSNDLTLTNIVNNLTSFEVTVDSNITNGNAKIDAQLTLSNSNVANVVIKFIIGTPC